MLVTLSMSLISETMSSTEEGDYNQEDEDGDDDDFLEAPSSKRAKKKIKKESSPKEKKYAVGSLLAVNLFGDDNYFEAVLKSYNRGSNSKNKNCLWAKMHYLHDDSYLQNDLNLLKVIDLSQEKIIELEDGKNKLNDNEIGFLGRRIKVQWADGIRYPGTVVKCTKDKKNFVYIKYEDGGDCWYNLDPSKEKVSGEAVKCTERKHPIGSHLSVACHHDDHYYDCIVKKYHENKSLIEKGEDWVFVHFCDATTKQWIDLNCIANIKIKPEKILTLDKIDDKRGNDIGFLGKRIEVEWVDGNKYCGIATKVMKNNKHFVFLEYDDGDKCWCDLEQENDWSVLDDNSKRKASAIKGEVGQGRKKAK